MVFSVVYGLNTPEIQLGKMNKSRNMLKVFVGCILVGGCHGPSLLKIVNFKSTRLPMELFLKTTVTQNNCTLHHPLTGWGSFRKDSALIKVQTFNSCTSRPYILHCLVIHTPMDNVKK